MDFHKFDFQFDIDKLVTDLEKCQQLNWPTHFNKNDYTGTWSSLSLRSISGRENDILATPGASFTDTKILDICPYFRSVLGHFDCQKEAVRLLSLSPNSEIREHRDSSSGYKDGFFRIHIPIQTNADVIFRLNGELLPMQPGECWYADFNLPHYVSNQGENDRIHLVIDCLRNDWSDRLFRQTGYDFEQENVIRYDRETKLQIIAQLEDIQTDTAIDLANRLRAELNGVTI